MKKKYVITMFALTMALGFTACGSSTTPDSSPSEQTDVTDTEENAVLNSLELSPTEIPGEYSDTSETSEVSETAQAVTTDSDTEEENATLESAMQEKSEDTADKTTVQGTCGYELQYDSSLFDFYTSEGTDNFSLKGQNLDSELPVYVAIQLYENTTSDELSNGMKLQTGRDDVEITETTIGSGNYQAKLVYVENDTDLGKQCIAYYAVQSDYNVLLIEAGGYIGQDASIDSALEEMLVTFTLQ